MPRGIPLTQEKFLLMAKEVHGDRYDYSKVIFSSTKKKVEIICPTHGSFYQLAHSHIYRRSICKQCSISLLSNQRKILSNEVLLEKVKNLQDRRDLVKDRTLYKPLLRRGLLEEAKKLLPSYINDMNITKRIVYAYEFEDNHVYVGLTYSLEKRHNQRLLDYGDAVTLHTIKTKLKPCLKKLTDFIPPEDAALLEQKFIEQYRLSGWNILNRVKGGALGFKKIIWTKEKCIEEAKKYKYRMDFKLGAPGAWTAIGRNGWRKEVCAHMPKKRYNYKKRRIRNIELDIVYSSGIEAARSINRSYSNLWESIKKGGRAGGYHWEYVD